MQGAGAYTHRGAAISAPMHKTRSRKCVELMKNIRKVMHKVAKISCHVIMVALRVEAVL